MNLPELILAIASLIAVALVWVDPRNYGQDLVAVVSLIGIVLISPLSALWLMVTILGSALLMRYCEDCRSIATGLWCIVLGLMLLLIRDLPTIDGLPVFWIGAAYFTLRQIHVVMDWWLLSTQAPSFRTLVRYNLLAPLILAGPIHRLPHFERAIARRYWSKEQFFCGAERALFGAVLAFVVGEFFYTQLLQELEPLRIERYFIGQIFNLR